MSTIYLIDGKPFRHCDCDEMSQVCPKGRVRGMMTCGYNRCTVPAHDVVVQSTPPEELTPLLEVLRQLDNRALHCRKVQAENEDKRNNNTADIFRVMANCHESDADLLRGALATPSPQREKNHG